MKRINTIILRSIRNIFILLASLNLISCEGDFLNRPPKTSITEDSFWKSTKDAETFVNQFYELFPGYGGYNAGNYWWDNNSDNMIPSNYNERLAGNLVTPTNGSRLSYGNVRKINYFLNKTKNLEVIDAQQAEKESLLGEGYFFRAYIYFNFLSSYGGVPWIDKVLTTESPELYSARESRNETADRIIADLDLAIKYLKSRTNALPFRLSKEVALALKSRVALFEGTWEKYHNGTVFGVKDADFNKYLHIAVDAAKELIDGKYGTNFSVFSTGKQNEDYFNLFNQSDLSSNSEILFWRKYDVEQKLAHNSQRYLGIIAGWTGLSQSLVNSYLCNNGKPISNSEGLYKGDDLPFNLFENRDARLRQTIFVKDDPITIENGKIIKKFDKGPIHLSSEAFSPTGYQLKKGSTPENSKKVQTTDFTSTTAFIIYRYGEVLLNYAEAKAELGTLTQADIDITVNKLRDRVGMSHLNISNITSDSNWEFPSLSPLLNEIRRERRCELACEGFRLNDIRRWRAHHLITGVKPLGMKFNTADYPTLQVGSNIHLSADGYVEPYAKVLPNGWGFRPERDYLSPLTLEELQINTNLKQNPGWDE